MIDIYNFPEKSISITTNRSITIEKDTQCSIYICFPIADTTLLNDVLDNIRRVKKYVPLYHVEYLKDEEELDSDGWYDFDETLKIKNSNWNLSYELLDRAIDGRLSLECGSLSHDIGDTYRIRVTDECATMIADILMKCFKEYYLDYLNGV